MGLVAQIVLTVIFGLLVIACTGAGIAGLVTEERDEAVGAVAFSLVLVIAFALAIVAVWS